MGTYSPRTQTHRKTSSEKDTIDSSCRSAHQAATSQPDDNIHGGDLVRTVGHEASIHK